MKVSVSPILATDTKKKIVTIEGEVGAELTACITDGGNLNITANPDGSYTIKPKFSQYAKTEMATRVIRTTHTKGYNYVDFFTRGETVFCMVYNSGRTFVGHATCAPGDKFDANIGKAIAYLRAMKKPVPRVLTA